MDQTAIVKQLDDLIKRYDEVRQQAKYDDLEDQPKYIQIEVY